MTWLQQSRFMMVASNNRPDCKMLPVEKAVQEYNQNLWSMRLRRDRDKPRWGTIILPPCATYLPCWTMMPASKPFPKPDPQMRQLLSTWWIAGRCRRTPLTSSTNSPSNEASLSSPCTSSTTTASGVSSASTPYRLQVAVSTDEWFCSSSKEWFRWLKAQGNPLATTWITEGPFTTMGEASCPSLDRAISRWS